MNLIATLTAEKEDLMSQKARTEELKEVASKKLNDTAEEIREAFKAVGLTLDMPRPGEESRNFAMRITQKGKYIEQLRLEYRMDCWSVQVDVYGKLDENIEAFKEAVAEKVKQVMSYTF